MRKSVLKNDPGYDKDAWKYVAYLDGDPVENAVTADEELGMIRILKDGKIHQRYGKVTIENIEFDST
jgi:hypothetical protein